MATDNSKDRLLDDLEALRTELSNEPTTSDEAIPTLDPAPIPTLNNAKASTKEALKSLESELDQIIPSPELDAGDEPSEALNEAPLNEVEEVGIEVELSGGTQLEQETTETTADYKATEDKKTSQESNKVEAQIQENQHSDTDIDESLSEPINDNQTGQDPDSQKTDTPVERPAKKEKNAQTAKAKTKKEANNKKEVSSKKGTNKKKASENKQASSPEHSAAKESDPTPVAEKTLTDDISAKINTEPQTAPILDIKAPTSSVSTEKTFISSAPTTMQMTSDSLTNAVDDNPFLPKHLRERLDQSKSELMEEISRSADALNASSAFLKSYQGTDAQDSSQTMPQQAPHKGHRELIDSLVAHYMPIIEADLRKRLEESLRNK